MTVWHVLPLPFIPWDTSSLLPFPLPRLPSYALLQYITHQYCLCNLPKIILIYRILLQLITFWKWKKICFWWNWHCDIDLSNMIGSISDDGMVHVTCTLGAGWYRYQVPTCVCMCGVTRQWPHHTRQIQLSWVSLVPVSTVTRTSVNTSWVIPATIQ